VISGCHSAHSTHATEIHGQTDKVPFSRCLLETSKAELPKAQDTFDPAKDRFDDDFPSAVSRCSFLGFQLSFIRWVA
jgi:hypothetical protein